MEIARDYYLQQLIEKKDNGRVKIVTGIRRCGKSYLVFTLFDRYLRESGVKDDQIISLALDELPNAKYRNPIELDKYVRDRIADKTNRYYVLIDEIQFVAEIQNPYVDDSEAKLTFVDVIIGLARIKNADIYITGSNSKMLSSDILTQFRDRGDEIHVNPLSFSEFHAFRCGEKADDWQEYMTFGGLPQVCLLIRNETRLPFWMSFLRRPI